VSQAVIIDAIRTPRAIAKDTGALHSLTPIDLLAGVLQAMQKRQAFDTKDIADAVFGCVTQTGEQGGNIGKAALAIAGWDKSVPAVTINRYCASGLTAVNLASMQATAADGLALAGGVEMMSRVAMLSDKAPLYSDPATSQAAQFFPLPLTADVLATREGITRADCDAYAALSQARAAAAIDSGRFAKSQVPVVAKDGRVLLERDETVRRGNTVEKLASMKTVYETGAGGLDAMILELNPDLTSVSHVHTAGNAPCMADGAAVALLATAASAKQLGLLPRARIIAHADAGAAGGLSGDGEATRKALARAKLRIDDIDLFEVRDSFAAPTLSYMRTLGVPVEKFNVNGSSIALGHPLGATGCMLISTLLDELERRNLRYGLAAITGAMGIATATVIDRDC